MHLLVASRELNVCVVLLLFQPATLKDAYKYKRYVSKVTFAYNQWPYLLLGFFYRQKERKWPFSSSEQRQLDS